MSERLIVVPDLHGDRQLLTDVLNRYENKVDGILLDGDMIDRGRESDQVIDLAIKADLQPLWASHTWVLMGSLTDTDPIIRGQWQKDYWRSTHNASYEKNMLRSYQVSESQNPESAARELRGRMEGRGHIAFIERSRMYHEAAEFVVIHAGLTDLPWQFQQPQLDNLGKAADQHNFGSAPPQLFSHEIAEHAREYLATFGSGKTVVTGHTHLRDSEGPIQRKTANGKRVRLASATWEGDPLHVWQSWDGQIVDIHTRR